MSNSATEMDYLPPMDEMDNGLFDVPDAPGDTGHQDVEPDAGGAREFTPTYTGTTGLSPVQRAVRDGEILDCCLSRGMTQREVASLFDVKQPTVAGIVKRAREAADGPGVDDSAGEPGGFIVTDVEPPAVDELTAPEDDGQVEYPSPTQPMRVARQLLTDLFSHTDGTHTLRWWRDDWWRWTGPSWQPAEELTVRGLLYEHLETATYIGQDNAPHPWSPDPAKLSKVLEPLRALTIVPEDQPVPAWTGPYGRPPATATGYPAGEFIGMSNGLLHVPTRTLIPHSPEMFNVYALDCDYDPDATAPEFHEFMSSTWAHDPAAVDMLQQWAGYLVSGRTDMHKALLLVGPPRSGKGVTSHLFEALVGAGNYVGTTLKSMSGEFGLSNVLNKTLVTLPDMRSSRAGDDGAAETILCITAGDTVTVNRKNKALVSVALGARLVALSNVVPQLRDPSGAVVTRFLIAETRTGHLGDEDRGLLPRLLSELSGVLNWALDGLDALDRQGQFTVAESGEDIREQMRGLSSPLRMFFDDTYRLTGDPEDAVEHSVVYHAYSAWAQLQGAAAMSQNRMVQELDAAVGLKTDQPRLTDPLTGKTRRPRRFIGLQAL